MLGACAATTGTLTQIINLITCLVGLVIPLALGLALLAFFWSLFRAFGKVDSVDGRKEAQQGLVWSALALFVVVSLAGIIAIFQATFPDLSPR